MLVISCAKGRDWCHSRQTAGSSWRFASAAVSARALHASGERGRRSGARTGAVPSPEQGDEELDLSWSSTDLTACPTSRPTTADRTFDAGLPPTGGAGADRGEAVVGFARRDGATRLADLYQRSPLRVLHPHPAT